MNAPLPSPLFAAVEMAPRDPILGITEAFNADKNPNKVNLGVGVYYDDNGKLPLLECVKRAEEQLTAKAAPRGYLPIDGIAAYDTAVKQFVFGNTHPAIVENRVVTVQALGGTGGLKVGADFLKRIAPAARVFITDPSWENHRALFEGAGFAVNTYAYYDETTHGLNFPAMLSAIEAMPAGSIIVLHACCHNPTGADLTREQWAQVIDRVKSRGLIPFLDMAYQGFGDGPDDDAWAVREFAKATSPVFVSTSFSKSMSLYGERVGALSIVAASSDEAARVLSQVKRVIRANYSNPPTHGGQVIATVLTTPELRALWEQELAGMRVRIKQMREELVAKLKAKVPQRDFSFVARQRGMFSYSGLSKDVAHYLRDKHSIYALDTGRICVAALNRKNVDAVIDAIAEALQKS